MANYLARVEDYVGSFSADTAAIDGWLTAAAASIIDRLPESKLRVYAVDVSISAAGTSLQNNRVYEVDKDGVGSIEQPLAYKSKVVDSGSVFYGTATNPAHLFSNGKLFIYVGGAAVTGNALAIVYPTVVNTDSTIANFPKEFEQAVVLYAAAQGSLYNANVANTALAALAYSAPTPPTPPSAPSFTYTDATGTVVAATTIDISAIPVPTYTKPTSAASYTNLETYIATDEDLEKADTERGQQLAKLNEYSEDIQNEVNEFNKELVAYKALVDEAFKNAELLQQKLISDAQRADNIDLANRAKQLEQQVSEYASDLGLYSAEISSYGAQVNSAVSKYQIDIQGKVAQIETWFKLYESLRSEYIDLLKLHGAA